MDFIEYNDGYKYQLKRNYSVQIPIKGTLILTRFIDLDMQGILTIKEGYAWDGPSGPTIDTKNFMRGSLVHDALYQLMREDHLSHAQHRSTADELLRNICRQDGMNPLRAWIVLKGVQWFGNPNADPRNQRPSIWAPDKPKSL